MYAARVQAVSVSWEPHMADMPLWLTVAEVVGFLVPFDIVRYMPKLCHRSCKPDLPVWLAVAEMAVFLVPFGIVQYMPNLFYGALLALFGIEITMDWLIHSYRKARTHHHCTPCVCLHFSYLETLVSLGVVDHG